MPLTRPYEEGLYARLQSLTYCVEYLHATKDDEEGFALALGDIIAAHTQTERAAHAETEARRQESFAHFEDVTQQLTATRDLALELVKALARHGHHMTGCPMQCDCGLELIMAKARAQLAPPCPRCKGTGSIPNGTDEMACRDCIGTGKLAPLPPKPTQSHDYLSTSCYHGIHKQCRLECKCCGVKCNCSCHSALPPAEKEKV